MSKIRNMDHQHVSQQFQDWTGIDFRQKKGEIIFFLKIGDCLG